MNKRSSLFILIISGFTLGIGVLTVKANEVPPIFPITNPNDAKTHGLDDLRSAKQDVLKHDLSEFLNEGHEAKKAFQQLGKALFWAEEVGSGGTAGQPAQACASCHFHAGADPRNKNQINPNLTRVDNQDEGNIVGFHNAAPNPDTTFQTRKPGEELVFKDFPFVKAINELDSAKNSNDVASSQGVLRSTFLGTMAAKFDDKCEPADDPVFRAMVDPIFRSIHGDQVRRVEPRNTPTVLNASLTSFFAFWDGRANPFFNGQNVFGVQDPSAKILVAENGSIEQERIDIPFSAMASQALGPPLSDFEMSCGVPEEGNARTWPEIGKKLLRAKVDRPALVPLGKQHVSPYDSVLGGLSQYPATGLNTTYADLIQKAFKEKYWKADGLRVLFANVGVEETQVAEPIVDMTPDGMTIVSETEAAQDVSDESAAPMTEDAYAQKFTLMEANMALFFGLAVQAYESTLITDDTWFDQWMRTGKFNKGFAQKELAGLNVFVDKGKCINCHGGPEFTNASVRNAQAGDNGSPDNIIEPMIMGDNKNAIYDNGFYNIAVTPTHEDIGRGGKGPTGLPLSSSRQRLFEENNIASIPFPILGGDKIPAISEDGLAVCDDVDNSGFCEEGEKLNAEFQRVAVDGAFKTPGLREVNLTGPYMHNGSLATLRQVVEFYNNGGNFCKPNLNNLDPDIQPLGLTNDEKENLVAFMISLSDQRVAFEKAPFDHPSLRVAKNGTRDGLTINVPVVGKHGRALLNLPPLKPFLGIDQQKLGLMPVNAHCSKQ